MANDPVSPRPLPFNIPEGFDAIKARDPKFWAAHRSWREAEDDYNAFIADRDDHPFLIAMGTRSTQLLDELLATPVRTASALLAKMEVLREAYCGDTSVIVCGKFTAADIIRFDLERLAKLEMFGPDAFQDMAEG